MENLQYPDFKTWKWKTYSGVNSNIEEFVKKYYERNFYIGTDSQIIKNKCVFTSVIVAHAKSGGSILIHKDKVDVIKGLRQRLLMEAFRSLEVAWYIDSIYPDSGPSINIHLDINSSLKYKSGKYHDELVGLVMGQNYSVSVKPDSWAASKIADKYCRK